MQTVHLVQRLDASPESAFYAWLSPDLVRLWMFATPTHEILHADIDPRPGGAFSIRERNGSDDIDHFGRFLEIIRPTRLVFSLEAPKYFKGVTCVLVQIRPSPSGGCILDFTQIGVERKNSEATWRNKFRQLQRLLVTK